MNLLTLLQIVAEYDKYMKDHYGDPVDFPHVAEWAAIKAQILSLVAESEDGE